MRIPDSPTLLRRMIATRVRQLRAGGPVLAASLVQIARSCGREGCRCQRGFKHVGNYLTCKVAGTTRTVYVSKDLLEDVQAWIEEHRRLKALDQEISQLVLAQVQQFVRVRKRESGRT